MFFEPVWRLLRANAERRPEAAALLAPGRLPLSYGELDRHVSKISGALACAGGGAGDRIALVCSNGPEMAAAFLAIGARSACAPLNPGYRLDEFEFYLSDLRPRFVIVEKAMDSPVREVARRHGIPVLDLAPRVSAPAGIFDIDGAAGMTAADQGRAGPDDIALLLHTSGTTARPKLTPLTNANLSASARNIASALELTEHDRCLNVMPLFHIHGLAAAVLATLASGGSLVCCPGFVAPKFFDWVEAFQPTWYTAVPTIHQSVLARAATDPERSARHRFRFIRSCSSALAPSVLEEMERVFRVPVVEAYGMTEAAHQMASNPLAPGPRKPGSVGVAAGPEVAVMDEDGNALPRGATGEVAIRGPNVTPGYVDNPEANRRSFTAGWFRTGDQGYLDSDGYLFLTGRLKEMINRGGEKVAPKEIDEVLLRHPAVAQAVAFAAPHASLGETVAAAVCLRPGLAATEMELREFCARYLADFKVPETIVFPGEIPKGATGKIQRIGLAERLGVKEKRRESAARAESPEVRTAEGKVVAALFAETLGFKQAGALDNFFERGGDSLLAAILISRIRDATGADVSLLKFLEDPTVSGICANLKSAPADGNGLHVAIRPGGALSPLFCFPGSTGNLMGICALARRLDPNQPVIAFRFPRTEPDRQPYRLEDLAARYVEEIFALQPEGPYYLSGVCTGGIAAYEAARQIAARGKSVALLALLDSANAGWGVNRSARERFAYRFPFIRKRLSCHLRRLRERGHGGIPAYLLGRAKAFALTTRGRWTEHAYGLLIRAGIRPPRRLCDSRILARYATTHYRPLPWPGAILLFRVEMPAVAACCYPDMGWRDIANGGLTIRDLPGTHLEMLSGRTLGLVAEGLAPYLPRECNSLAGSETA